MLARTLAGRPLSVERLIDFGTQIADALQAAHAERIVHRDLKPANIFVTRSGRIKLLDFGIAILLPRRPSLAPPGPKTSSKGGTIPYMSPEQAQADDLDHRSDLFSLGIILYEMATGRRPFSAATGTDTLAAIIGVTPPAPRTIDPRLPSGARAHHREVARKESRAPLPERLGPQGRPAAAETRSRCDREREYAELQPGQPSPTPVLAELTAAVIGAVLMAAAGWLANGAVRARWSARNPRVAGFYGHPPSMRLSAIRRRRQSAQPGQSRPCQAHGSRWFHRTAIS